MMFDFKKIAIATPTVQRFSPSKLGSFAKCKLGYKLRYIDKIEIKDVKQAIETLQGKALHEVADKYEGGDIFALAKPAFDKYGMLFLPDNIEMNKAILSIKKFKDDMIAKSSLIKSEEKVEWNLTPEIVLNGIIDGMFFMKDGTLHIVDYKSSKSQGDSRYVDQLQMYAFVASKLFDTSLDAIKSYIYYIRLAKCGEPVATGARLLNMYEHELKSQIAAIGTTTTWPATTSFMCKYCDYQGTSFCPASCAF